jgi:transketolase
VEAARDTGAVVTAEEHYINGGLGSLVSQALSRELPTPVESVALRGYAESGTAEQLLSKYGLTSGDIERAVRRAIARKRF